MDRLVLSVHHSPCIVRTIIIRKNCLRIQQLRCLLYCIGGGLLAQDGAKTLTKGGGGEVVDDLLSLGASVYGVQVRLQRRRRSLALPPQQLASPATLRLPAQVLHTNQPTLSKHAAAG